jgi:alkylation response protein AidB-like acyl-CoA dehydrogenase
MDFNYTDEQQALQDTLNRFIERDYDFDKRRARSKSVDGFSRDTWKQIAELGLLALPLPEAHGGVGGSPIDTKIVMEAIGKGLMVEPYMATVVLGAGLIAAAGSEAQKAALLPQVAEGKLLLAFAHGERAARYDLDHVATTAKADGAGHVLNGAKGVVLNGDTADKLIISARTSGKTSDRDGISLFLVDRTATGVKVRGYATQDGGRAAEVELANVKVVKEALLGGEGKAAPHIARIIDVANAALCAEAVGIMEAVNESTRDYLKTRVQFGKAIGTFQALQHRMADMIVNTEQAKSMAILAAVKASSSDAAERSRTISGAKAYIGGAARFVGQQAVQLHGGMGVVDEMRIAHYFKRLTMIGQTFGDTDWHLARYSDGMSAA